MDLPNLEQLSKIIDLCRKKGVSSITLGDIRLEIREAAPVSSYKKRKQSDSDESSEQLKDFPTGILTDEQLMYYSAGGIPALDPEKDS